MKTTILIAGLAAASLFAQPPHGPRGFGPGPGGPPMETVTGAPYSGVEVHARQQVLANGTVIQHQDQTKVARDSQGRVRREVTRQTPDGKTETRITISDPVAGMVHELDPANKTAFSHPARFPNGQQPRNIRQPQESTNTKRETMAAQSINGVIASGSRITHTIPAGTIGNSAALETVHETWMADDLRVPVKTKMSDPRTGTSTMELTNLLRGEPDASLFTIPSDYTVQKASGGRGPRAGGPPPPRK
jgi:hypothetical protein